MTGTHPGTTVIFPVRSGCAGATGRRRTSLIARLCRTSGPPLVIRAAGRRLLRTGRLCYRLLRALLPALPVSVAAGARRLPALITTGPRLPILVVLRDSVCLVAARRAVAA